MTSIDDKLQTVQDNVLDFLRVSVEPLFTEYIAIPLFFEWTFNSKQLSTLRAPCVFLLLVRQLIKQNIKVNKPYSNLLVVAALLAYVSVDARSDLTTAIIYSFAYSPAIALTTSTINATYSFNGAVAFHALYILVRNNLHLDTKQLVKLQITRHKTFYERRTDIEAMSVSLIHKFFDLAD